MPPRIYPNTGDVEVLQLQAVVADINSLINEIRNRQGNNLVAQIVAELEECCQWARNIAAHANGYLAEFKIYIKHHNKGRFVQGPQGQKARQDIFRGDLLVGRDQGDGFSKTMQIKAVTTDRPKAVEDHITTALEQLSGSGGEKARTTDRWVINVHIHNQVNPWPFAVTENQPPHANAFRARVQNATYAIWLDVTSRTKHKKRLLDHSMKDIKHTMVEVATTNLARPHTSAYDNINRQGVASPVRKDIILNIYYTPQYGLADGTLVWKARVRFWGSANMQGLIFEPDVELFTIAKTRIP